MAKTTAPLLSFDASGQIGQSQVYSSWKGRAYARRYVVPANPRSTEQTKTRSTFAWLHGLVKFFGTLISAPWDAYATTSRFTRTNGVIKQNLPELRGKADLADMIMTPSAGSGIPVTSAAIVASDGTLTVTVTPPPLPAGWTIEYAAAAAIPDQDPATEADYTIVEGSAAAAPYTIALAGLTNGQLYRVGAWCKYIKSDGSAAYGEALLQSGTPAA